MEMPQGEWWTEPFHFHLPYMSMFYLAFHSFQLLKYTLSVCKKYVSTEVQVDTFEDKKHTSIGGVLKIIL